ncbi:MAG: diguanylate cyclase [Gemmatimonadales bacterium]|nr:diguanylate cyclase [Gemmatimonadales bacterium]MDZ4389610.1 diguanylate cyclase [Gemmatimonadales bacterium]
MLAKGREATLVMDAEGIVTAANEEATRLFGWLESDICGRPITQLIPDRFHRVIHLWPLREPADSKGSHADTATIALMVRRSDGTELGVEISRYPLDPGRDSSYLVIIRDVSAARDIHVSLLREKEVARLTLDSIGDGVLTTDLQGVVTYLNPVAERLTGWRSTEAVGQSVELVMPLINDATRAPVDGPVSRCLRQERSVDLPEGLLLLCRDGTEMSIDDSAAPLRERNGKISGAVLVFHDTSERRRVLRGLTHASSHDPLTGIANRSAFERLLGRLIGEIAEAGDKAPEHALCYFDLDRFKAVNDTAGHAAGDALLQQVATLLGGQLRRRDTLARLGGDEFVALLQHCTLAEATEIADACCAAVRSMNFPWSGQTFTIGVSVGVVPITAATTRTAVLLDAADAACYTAKRAGGDCIQVSLTDVWTPPLDDLEFHRMARVARSVDEDAMLIHVQPIVSLRESLRAARHYEVILLPAVNRSGEITPDHLDQAYTGAERAAVVDRWVIRRTVELLAQWRLVNRDVPWPVCLVPLAADAVLDAGLVPAISTMLATCSVPAEALSLQVTEAVALGNFPAMLRLTTAHRAQGGQVAISEFGNSLEAFTHLKALPVNQLILSGHHIRGMVTDPVYAKLIGAIGQIGTGMGIATVARHVDTPRMLTAIRMLGVGYVQGDAVAPARPILCADGAVVLPVVRIATSRTSPPTTSEAPVSLTIADAPPTLEQPCAAL